MSSSGGKGDGEDQSQIKHRKNSNGKAEDVKKYYKKKFKANNQDDSACSSSPRVGQHGYSSSATRSGMSPGPHTGDNQGRTGSAKKRQNYPGGKETQNPKLQSYSQLKNYGRRDLSADFEENCSIGERIQDYRQGQSPVIGDGIGLKHGKRTPSGRGGNRVNSPRQAHGRGAPVPSPNRQSKTPKGKDNASSKRSKCFEPYWKKEDVQAGLKRGQLVEGPVRINPSNYEEAYVAHPDGQSDIYIRGLSTRNRALNGDWVAVFLEDRDNWRVNIAKMEESADALIELVQKCRNQDCDVVVEEEYEESTEGDASSTGDVELSCSKESSSVVQNRDCKAASTMDEGGATSQTSQNSEINGSILPKGKEELENRKQEPAIGNSVTEGENQKGKTPRKQRDNTDTPKKRAAYTALKDVGTQSSGSAKLEVIFSPTKIGDKLKVVHDAIPDEYLQRTGKVVYITEKKHSRASTGHLKPSSRANFALFSPTDHRVPRINIQLSDCPQGFQQRPEDHAKTLFVARITDWNEDQLMPLGTLARSLGEAGEIEPETEGILISYDVDSGEFPQACLDCLPDVSPANPWRIPQSEFSYRRDFRQECVFTIDPPSARDLDDALHVNDLGNDEYEVGVHIADVSYFVQHDTALDTVAASRATSVYLVQKVIPMLPRLLCEQLCSLNPDEDRLTFSVVWRVTGTGQILDEWFGRSVIRSCVKLGYNHAQGFLDEPDRHWTQAELPPLSTGYEPELIKQKVLILNKIAKNLRKKRYDGGALSLNQVKMQFTLDRETGMPCGYSVYQQKDSNRLIEEFMLLANMAVARKIYETFPESAVLRRHPPPQQKMVDELQELLQNLAMPVDFSSAKCIQESLLHYTGEDKNAEAQSQILTALCSKAMQLAKYFCTGMYDDPAVYRHYALSVPLYTHFTSPIRRYPDVLVHRALAAALDYTELPNLEKEKIQKQCTHCNDKKIAAKSVQDLSSNLFFAAFVKECGPLEERGMVMGLSEKSFDVLLLNLGLVKRVFVEKLPVESSKFRVSQKKPELLLVWKSDSEHPTQQRQTLTIFSPVKCALITDSDDPLRFNCLLKHPDDPLVSTHLPDKRPEDTQKSAIVINYEDV